MEISSSVKSALDKSNSLKETGRPPKEVKYKKEREDIVAQFDKILGLTKENRMIYVCDIESNDEIQEKLMEYKDDVKKYFHGATRSIFRKETKNDTKRPFMSLIRCVYTDMNYDVLKLDKSVKRDDKKIMTTCYYITKKS